MQKYHKVRARMVTVRMVRVFSMSVDETVSLQVRCPTWIRDWLRRYDEGRPKRPPEPSPMRAPRRIPSDELNQNQ